MHRAFIVFAAVLMLSACAGGYAGQSYSPVVDVYGSPGKDPAMYSNDLAACQNLAAQRNQVGEGAQGAAVGAVLGAGAGAIGGAIGGRPGLGAGLGAAGGALAGGASSTYQSNVNRQDIVMNCMRGRGWTVVGR